jgi:hypothetical protein
MRLKPYAERLKIGVNGHISGQNMGKNWAEGKIDKRQPLEHS